MSIEELSYGGPEGCKASGAHRQVIKEGVAARQLKANESGALCIYDRAAGVVYTLPTPVAGMTFEFAPSVKTSGEYKVITKTIGSEFILGTIIGYSADITESDGMVANGTNIVSVNHNGTTTGGDAGGSYTLTAISTTQWLIEGDFYTGTAVPNTPFDTT